MNSEPEAARVLVVTDSTACVTGLGDYAGHLQVIPLHITVAGKTYREGHDIDQGAVVNLIARGVQVTTSQPNLQEFEDLFTAAFAQGFTHVVCAVISGKLSGTAETARQAAKKWAGNIVVLDSKVTALALGVAALAGAKAAKSGANSTDVSAIITERTQRAGALFMVDSLEHLRRGGRLSGPMAAVGAALGLKPILILKDGEIQIAAKVRSRNAALAQMFSQAVIASDLKNVEFGIHYFGADTFALKLAQQIEGTFGRPVHVTPASAVLGAHVGPGLVALTYS